MKPKDQIPLLARKLWARNSSEEFKLSTLELWFAYNEQYKKMIDLFHPGDYYSMLFDLVVGDVAYISDEVEEILGYPKEKVTLELFLNVMHPQDREHFVKFEDYFTKFLSSTPKNEYPNYKLQYDFRLATKEGKYKRLLMQIFIVNYSEDNIFHSFHIHTDITHIKPTGRPTCSIIGLNGRPSYLNIANENLEISQPVFTKREYEILYGIIEGKTSQQIADELCISIYTVNSHRRNILEKAQVKTPLELMQKAFCEGWI